MRKKAAKKAAKKTAKKAKPGADITIALNSGSLPDEFEQSAHKNLTDGTPDRVRWANNTSRGRTLVFDFDWWPFEEAPEDIVIQKNKKSPWYHISVDAVSTGYPYHVSPPLVTGQGPDEPKIVVED